MSSAAKPRQLADWRSRGRSIRRGSARAHRPVGTSSSNGRRTRRRCRRLRPCLLDAIVWATNGGSMRSTLLAKRWRSGISSWRRRFRSMMSASPLELIAMWRWSVQRPRRGGGGCVPARMTWHRRREPRRTAPTASPAPPIRHLQVEPVQLVDRRAQLVFVEADHVFELSVGVEAVDLQPPDRDCPSVPRLAVHQSQPEPRTPVVPAYRGDVELLRRPVHERPGLLDAHVDVRNHRASIVHHQIVGEELTAESPHLAAQTLVLPLGLVDVVVVERHHQVDLVGIIEPDDHVMVVLCGHVGLRLRMY